MKKYALLNKKTVVFVIDVTPFENRLDAPIPFDSVREITGLVPMPAVGWFLDNKGNLTAPLN